MTASPRKDFSDLSSLYNEDGRISVDDFNRYIDVVAEAESEARRPVLEKLNAKKKKAVDELIKLGVSKESAQLILGQAETVERKQP